MLCVTLGAILAPGHWSLRDYLSANWHQSWVNPDLMGGAESLIREKVDWCCFQRLNRLLSDHVSRLYCVSLSYANKALCSSAKLWMYVGNGHLSNVMWQLVEKCSAWRDPASADWSLMFGWFLLHSDWWAAGECRNLIGRPWRRRIRPRSRSWRRTGLSPAGPKTDSTISALRSITSIIAKIVYVTSN